MKFDFIVIGSGLAGLATALVLKDKGTVVLVTKSKLSDNATNLAQGGICCVVEKDDSFRDHIRDTLIVGAYHNNKRAVEYMVRNAPVAIDWLVKQGVRFERKNGEFVPTCEAAHLRRRVLHATDFTGREIERALVEKVKSEQNICIWENCFTLDLLVEKNKCSGIQAIKNNRIENLFSRAVILATGGLGQIYQWTTNPKIATGDGIAIAERAGAELEDLEFIQFHPTALDDGKSPLFLLSEALRGEGAYLIKWRMENGECPASAPSLTRGLMAGEKGERFMEKIDPRGELAPRDIVARAILEEQKKGNSVFLDIRHRGEKFIKGRFPNIYQELKKRGFDLTSEPIPVTPAAHYSCGGIKVDLYGRTSVKNLFAFGEVAATGAHGANRLASNSLLEAVVFPLRLPQIFDQLSRKIEKKEFAVPSLCLKTNYHFGELRDRLRKLMWEKAGIERTFKGLTYALVQVKEWEREAGKEDKVNIESSETKNMLAVARLIIQRASRRKKSLGAHFIQNLLPTD